MANTTAPLISLPFLDYIALSQSDLQESGLSANATAPISSLRRTVSRNSSFTSTGSNSGASSQASAGASSSASLSSSSKSACPSSSSDNDVVPVGTDEVLLGIEYEPNQYDVICGRGFVINKHDGNMMLRKMVLERLDAYLDNTRRAEKTLIIQSIVDAVRGKGGKFLRKNEIVNDGNNNDTYDNNNSKTKKRKYSGTAVYDDDSDDVVEEWIEISAKMAYKKVRLALRDANAERRRKQNKVSLLGKKRRLVGSTGSTSTRTMSCTDSMTKGALSETRTSARKTATKAATTNDVVVIDNWNHDNNNNTKTTTELGRVGNHNMISIVIPDDDGNDENDGQVMDCTPLPVDFVSHQQPVGLAMNNAISNNNTTNNNGLSDWSDLSGYYLNFEPIPFSCDPNAIPVAADLSLLLLTLGNGS